MMLLLQLDDVCIRRYMFQDAALAYAAWSTFPPTRARLIVVSDIADTPVLAELTSRER